ncbi:hypothetical protein [Macrococcus armenti]|uniref:hypothetical protein n=1 Tax=Macrococcus armenti TaxID=2875764 RepID=UPI001CCE3E50|nr:hypothetical protein [Macrococcus armenti]UBH12136.1 hypothetical protein LAU43_05980 [Macrococcus armenti]
MLSLFIMDVSSSTQMNNQSDIRNAMENITAQVERWSEPLQFKYTNFRMGDELFFVCDNLASTLLISYYIKLIWPFKAQPVKFGIAAGDEPVPDMNIEHWNSKLTKLARTNLEQIKRSDITDFQLSIYDMNTDIYNDVLFPYFTSIVKAHSKLQQSILVQSLYTETQKEIAQINHKSESTISSHLNKAQYKQLSLIKKHLLTFDTDIRIEKNIKASLKGGLPWY